MDKTDYTIGHRKGQHLTAEERHIIEVRYNKDHLKIYRIAKELNCPYNTVKNEIERGTDWLYNGTVKRYKANAGEAVYLERRRESRPKYKALRCRNSCNMFKNTFGKTVGLLMLVQTGR